MPKPSLDPARKAWPLLAIFVLVGFGFMTPFALQAIRDYRIAKIYLPTECQIVGKRTVTSSSKSTLGGRWVENQHSHKEFTWAYRVGGLRYTAAGYDNHDGIMADSQETGNISPGIKHDCWYDPAAPANSVLVRHFRGKFYLGALIPGSFIFIGSVLLRGVLRRKPQKIDASTARGERLLVRLVPALSTKGLSGCLGSLIMLLGLVGTLVLPGISIGSSSGDKAWVYLIGMGIEGFLIYHFIRAVRAARIGDPIVEINDEPLIPGQATQIYIRHPAPARLASYQAQIVCEKVSQNGTRVAYKELLFDRSALTITEADEFTTSFSIPEKASVSMKTVQTATNWYVRIRRKLDKGERFDVDYPFRITRVDDEAE